MIQPEELDLFVKYKRGESNESHLKGIDALNWFNTIEHSLKILLQQITENEGKYWEFQKKLDFIETYIGQFLEESQSIRSNLKNELINIKKNILENFDESRKKGIEIKKKLNLVEKYINEELYRRDGLHNVTKNNIKQLKEAFLINVNAMREFDVFQKKSFDNQIKYDWFEKYFFLNLNENDRKAFWFRSYKQEDFNLIRKDIHGELKEYNDKSTLKHRIKSDAQFSKLYTSIINLPDNISALDLIEQYFLGVLNENKIKDFELRLKSDANFSQFYIDTIQKPFDFNFFEEYIRPAEIDLIERFIRGELSENQIRDFELKIKSDAHFNKLYEDMLNLSIAIKEVGRNNLRQKLKRISNELENENNTIASVPEIESKTKPETETTSTPGNKYRGIIIIFLIAALLVIVGVFVIQSNNTYITFVFISIGVYALLLLNSKKK